jgi:hypothetical protein
MRLLPRADFPAESATFLLATRHAIIILWLLGLCSPNEDFGKMNRGLIAEFRSTFQFTPPKRRFCKVEPTFPNVFPGEALFKGVSTRFGLRIVEKCFPGKHIRKVWLGLPKSSFGEHTIVSCPNWVLTPLKSASKIHINHVYTGVGKTPKYGFHHGTWKKIVGDETKESHSEALVQP